MALIQTSMRIAAPIEAVYVFFVPQRMPYWYGAEMSACLRAQNGAANFAVGQTVGITGHLGQRNVSHTAVVTAMRRPSLFEWEFEDEYGVKGLDAGSWRRKIRRTLAPTAPRSCACAAITKCPAHWAS